MHWMLPFLFAAQITSSLDAERLEQDRRATINQPAHYLMTIRVVDEKGKPVPKARVSCDGYWMYLHDREPSNEEPIPLSWAPAFKAESLGGVTYNVDFDSVVPFTCRAWDSTRSGSVEITLLLPRMIVRITIR